MKLVIFDMDGLLFDTEGVTYQAFCEVGTKKGFSPRKDQYVQLLGLNETDILKKYKEFFGPDVDAAAMYKQIGGRKMDILWTDGVPVKPGLAKLLDALDARGITRAIASGSDQDVIEQCVKNTGFQGRFDYMLSTKGVKRGKPYPDVFLTICDHFGVAPEDTLVLEDSRNGVEAALAGNIPVINIPDMLPIPKELQKQCVAVVDTLEGVICYL